MASLIQTDATGLNEYAKNYKAIYPIAARCGVFAKTDIQPLINRRCNQGRLISLPFSRQLSTRRSAVLHLRQTDPWTRCFLRRSPHFLSELKAFIHTLNLDEEHAITPLNSHLFAAIGSALNYKEDKVTTLAGLHTKLQSDIHMEFEVARLDPLFKDQAEYDAFRTRHDGHHVKSADLALRRKLLPWYRCGFHHNESCPDR